MKKKSSTVIIVITIFLLFTGIISYLVINKNDKDAISDNQENTKDISENKIKDDKEEEIKFTYYSSTDALTKVNNEAIKWANDAKLYSCAGMTLSSYTTDNKVYEFLGNQNGAYMTWFCEVYSPSKNATSIVTYEYGEVEITEPMELDQYSVSTYKNVNYPSDVTKLANTKTLYDALSSELNIEQNYYNQKDFPAVLAAVGVRSVAFSC